MLSFLFAAALSAQKTSGYEEYKLSSFDPVTITIPTNYEAVVLLSFSSHIVTLKVTSTTGSVKTHQIFEPTVRAFRVEGAQFTLSIDTSYTYRIGVWLIPNDICYGAAIGLSGSPSNYSITFNSIVSKPTNVCIFPMADENSFISNVVFGSTFGTAYHYTDKYLTGKTTTMQYCKDGICKLSQKEEDQWFIRYVSYSQYYPLVLNYEFNNVQSDFTGCFKNTMLSYNMYTTSYYYTNSSSYSCGIDISSAVGFIVLGVVLALIFIIAVIVLICCWPCIAACCCAAAAVGGASSSTNTNINQPLHYAEETYTPQYPPQYPQQYPPQYPQQYPPQQPYNYEYPK